MFTLCAIERLKGHKNDDDLLGTTFWTQHTTTNFRK